MRVSRRDFVVGTIAAGAAANLAVPRPAGFKGSLALFSKHFPAESPGSVARRARQLGFAGLDLTVRRGGHVPPERAVAGLPPAVAAIRQEGIEVAMITTELLSAGEPARPLLSTAGRLGIRYFKPGYYRYKFADVRAELDQAGSDFRSLVRVAAECGVAAGYHNHAGYIGAPIWDMATVIEPLDPHWAGYYFDPCHAVTEGGVAAWRIAAQRFAPRIKMIAVKDFYWEKTARGWRPRMCPLGEGMVDWKGFFGIVAKAGFAGPVSLHIEYEIQGTSPEEITQNTWKAAERDLRLLKATIDEAYG